MGKSTSRYPRILSLCLGGIAKFFRKNAVDATSRENARLIGKGVQESNPVITVKDPSGSGLISLKAASSICSTSDLRLGGSYVASILFGRARSFRVTLMTSSSSVDSLRGLVSLALVPQVRFVSAGDDDGVRFLMTRLASPMAKWELMRCREWSRKSVKRSCIHRLESIL